MTLLNKILLAGFLRLRAHPRLALAWPRYGILALAVTVVLNAPPKAHLDVMRGFFGRTHALGLLLRERLAELGNGAALPAYMCLLRARGPLTLRERTHVYDDTGGPAPTPIDEDYAARYLTQLHQFIDTV